jgi:hypothetical protein
VCAENYFIFQEEITDAMKRKYDVRLFFSTVGGSMGMSENMIEIINTYPHKLEMICNEYLLSSGLMIVGAVKKPIRIGNSCIGLAHAPSILLESRGTKKKTGFDSYMQKQEEVFIEQYLKNIKPVLTEEEIREVRAGEDICIDAGRIRELIKIQQTGV